MPSRPVSSKDVLLALKKQPFRWDSRKNVFLRHADIVPGVDVLETQASGMKGKKVAPVGPSSFEVRWYRGEVPGGRWGVAHDLADIKDAIEKVNAVKDAAQQAYELGEGYDALVKDKNLLPKPLSARYVKELKRLLKGAAVKVVKSESIAIRGWDYGNYTVLEITPKNAETVRAAITLNVASDEVSGNATLDAPYGVITVPRYPSVDRFLTALLSEVAGRLQRTHENSQKMSGMIRELRTLAGLR